MNITKDLIAKVDELGFLLAQIAELTEQADAIKAEIKASGAELISGDLYSATVIEQDRQTLDRKAVEKVLTRDVLTGCLKTTHVVSVKVTSRKAA